MKLKSLLILLSVFLCVFCLSGCGLFSAVFGLSKAADGDELHEDIAEYEALLGPGAAGKLRGSFGLNEGIFPAALTEDMKVAGFRYLAHSSLDPAFLAYLTVDYTPEAYALELERLAALPRTEYRGVYSVTGFANGMEPLAVSAGETGFVYAVKTPARRDSVSYVLLEFYDRFLELEPGDYIPEALLPLGLDTALNNPYSRQIAAEYELYDKLRIETLDLCEPLDPALLLTRTEPEAVFYRADEFNMEFSCGGLFSYFANPGGREVAPALLEDLDRIGAVEHRTVLEQFLEDNQIDLRALSGFDWSRQQELYKRYDFDGVDAKLGALRPLWQILNDYARAHSERFECLRDGEGPEADTAAKRP